MRENVSLLRRLEKNSLWLRLISIMMTAILFISLNRIQVSAVTGSQVAADGVYTSTVRAYKYKEGKLKKSYYGTLNVAVIDGEIAGLWITNASDDKMSKLITTDVYYNYVGKEASVTNAGGVDAVSSSTVSTSTTGGSYSTAKKYYTSDLADAVVAALNTALERKTNSSESSSEPVQTVTGTASVVDSEGSKLVLNVGLDTDGKVVSLTADSDSCVGSWDSIISKNAEHYIGKSADEIDAVSGATQYSAAVHTALTEALAKTTSAVVEPKIIEGDGVSWTKGSTTGLTFRSDADYSLFLNKVTVDGSTVPTGKFTAKSGSTVVTLDSSYLETLGTGSHSVGIVSSTGTASATFAVAADTASSGDSTSSDGVLADGTYTYTENMKLYSYEYDVTVTLTVSNGKFTSVTAEPSGNIANKDEYVLKNAVYSLNQTLSGQTATTDAINNATYSSSGVPYPSWADYSSSGTAFDNIKSAAAKAELEGSSGGSDAGKTISPGKSATIYVGETLTLQGTKPSSYGNYHYWYTDEDDVDYIEWDIDNNASSSYYAGTNIANVTGITAGTVTVYHQYVSGGSWVNPGETFTITVKEKEDTNNKAKIELDKSAVTLELGANGSVKATPTGCTDLTVTSSNADVATATISDNAISVTGVSAGTAVITVNGTATSGYSAPDSVTFTVTVNPGGGGTGTGSGGTTETTPGNPTYVKSISPENQVAEEYTISLNVTGDDMESTTTTPGMQGKGTNLVIVIDISGSIVGKETALNAAIKSLVNSLPKNSQVGVVTFNDSASMSKVYSPSTISGLTFSGVENAGTKMATGIAAAASLLNGSGWSEASNDKAMAIISDFDIDDYADAINNAKTAKSANTKIYSVKIDATSVGAANRTELTTDERVASIDPATRYISSQYPGASAVNNSMFGMFNQATVTPGTADNNASYVYGAGGGNWSEIFQEIKETQGMTETSTVPMKNVVITDTLSPYVELSGTGSNYGVLLEPSDNSVSLGTVSTSKDADGNTVVSAALNGELTDGTTYTVKIPVKPTEKAQTEANESPDSTKSFISNVEAKMAYEYDEENKGEVTYEEIPKILVAKQVTLTYDANAGDDTVDNMPNPAQSAATTVNTSGVKTGYATFDITSSEPSREGYIFHGWAETADATEATYKNEAGKNSIDIDEDTTLYAVWAKLAVKITFERGADDTTGVMDPQEEEYGSTFKLKENSFVRTGYTFTGWKVKAVTDPSTLLQRLFSAKARAKAKENDTYKDKEELSDVKQDITLEAQWTPIEYKITYNLDGGSVSETNPEKYTIESEDITLNNPTKDGYTFAGWKGTDLTNASDNVTIVKGSTGDRVYTATWTQNEHKVTYTVKGDVPDGYSAPPETTQKTGDSVTVEAAGTTDQTEKDGVPGTWEFSGWTTSDATVNDGKFSMPDKDVTMTGTWTFTEVTTPPEQDTSYTVSTASKHTYEIYQILKGDYETLDGKDVLTNAELGSNGKLPTGETLENALEALKAVADEAAHTDKEQLTVIEKYVDLNSTPVKTVTDGTPATGLEGGYYLIRDLENWNGKYHASTTYITLIVKDQTFTPKSLRPTVDKQVSDDENAKDGTSDTNTTNISSRWNEIWGESADHTINESFQFRLIAMIPASEHMIDYAAYKLVFTDTMSPGVTFDSIASVTINGKSINSGNYEVSGVSQGDAGKTWTLTINDVKKAADGLNIDDDGAEVVVTYNAHLNANAIAFDASTAAEGIDAVNKNSVYLEYSNNPNTGHDTEMGKTVDDTVWVFTYKLNNTKYADEATPGNELANAEFEIRDSTNKAMKLIEGDGTYTVADQDTTTGFVTTMKSNSSGKFDVIGLDVGEYTLVETKAPEGYNTIADQTVLISATHKETDDTAHAALNLNNDSTMNLNIVDQSGSVLPSTGGIGTTIFYILGSVLVLGAGVILVSRRRISV